MTVKSACTPSDRAEPPTIGILLAEAVAFLEPRIPAPAHLDAEVLLAETLGVERGVLLARSEQAVVERDAVEYRRRIGERGRGRPVAHITGHKEFYGIELKVGSGVFVPRPETELLVDWALELLDGAEAPRVADLCTGSGCLAVAIATELPGARVVATDLSEAALEVTRENIVRHGLGERIVARHADLAGGLEGPYDLVVCNPPYVAREDDRLEDAVRDFEPRNAVIDPIDGDGLGVYRRLVREIPSLLRREGTLLLEVGDGQAPAVRALAAATGWRTQTRADLAGIERSLALEPHPGGDARNPASPPGS